MICCLKIKSHPDSSVALQLHFCANQPQAQRKPRLPAAETVVISQIACELGLKMVIYRV